MSDSPTPGKPGQPRDNDPPSRPDLFEARTQGGKPSRREDTVRILSTMKPGGDASGAKNTRALWISAAAVCTLAVAGWYANHSEPGTVNGNTPFASTGSVGAGGAPSSASPPQAAATAMTHTAVGPHGEPPQRIATVPPSPAESQPGAMAPLAVATAAAVTTQAHALPGQAEPAPALARHGGLSAMESAPASADAPPAPLNEPPNPPLPPAKAGHAVASKTDRPASKTGSKPVAKAGSSANSKASRTAQAKREEATRLAKARRGEERRLAQAASPAGRPSTLSSTSPAAQREADADASVIEALLPYVKRSPAKAGAKAASSTVSSVNAPVHAR